MTGRAELMKLTSLQLLIPSIQAHTPRPSPKTGVTSSCSNHALAQESRPRSMTRLFRLARRCGSKSTHPSRQSSRGQVGIHVCCVAASLFPVCKLPPAAFQPGGRSSCRHDGGRRQLSQAGMWSRRGRQLSEGRDRTETCPAVVWRHVLRDELYKTQGLALSPSLIMLFHPSNHSAAHPFNRPH